MSYDEDVRLLTKLERYRLFAVIGAIVLLLASLALDTDLLDWPRAIAWAIAGGISIYEGRIYQRVGRDAAGPYLRAVLFFLAAGLCLV